MKENKSKSKNNSHQFKKKSENKRAKNPVIGFFDNLFGLFKFKGKSVKSNKHEKISVKVEQANNIPVKTIEKNSVLKPLTDKQFEDMLYKIVDKINTLSDNSEFDIEGLDKNNILFLYKVLSDEKLYNNKNVKGSLKYIMTDNEILKTVSAKISIADKYISDEKWYQNPVIKQLIGTIMINSNDEDCAKARIMFVDKYVSDEKFYNSKYVNENIETILYGIHNTDAAAAKIMLIDKYCSDIRWQKDAEITKKMFFTLLNAEKIEVSQKFIEEIDKVLDEEESKIRIAKAQENSPWL